MAVVPLAWQHREPMTLRMLYLTFVRMAGWMALMARSSAAQGAELLVLRQEAGSAAAAEAKPHGPMPAWASSSWNHRTCPGCR